MYALDAHNPTKGRPRMPAIKNDRIAILKDAITWKLVQDSLETLLKQLGETAGGRSCGFFRAFLIEQPGDFTTMVPIYKDFHHNGDIPTKKLPRYRIVSLEKAIRLGKNCGVNRHVSSFQSRNLSANEYGGSILVMLDPGGLEIFYLILSFSGLPEKADEALCLLIASQLSLATKNWAKLLIIEASDNEIARALGI